MHYRDIIMLRLCAVNYMEVMWSRLTGLSVLQQVTVQKSPSRRTCPNTQTKQKPKFVLVFCKEWEIQCECVGKPVNHCCVAKTTDTEKKTTWKAKLGLSNSFLLRCIYG